MRLNKHLSFCVLKIVEAWHATLQGICDSNSVVVSQNVKCSEVLDMAVVRR